VCSRGLDEANALSWPILLAVPSRLRSCTLQRENNGTTNKNSDRVAKYFAVRSAHLSGPGLSHVFPPPARSEFSFLLGCHCLSCSMPSVLLRNGITTADDAHKSMRSPLYQAQMIRPCAAENSRDLTRQAVDLFVFVLLTSLPA
jgi:hypothetical protein